MHPIIRCILICLQTFSVYVDCVPSMRPCEGAFQLIIGLMVGWMDGLNDKTIVTCKWNVLITSVGYSLWASWELLWPALLIPTTLARQECLISKQSVMFSLLFISLFFPSVCQFLDEVWIKWIVCLLSYIRSFLTLTHLTNAPLWNSFLLSNDHWMKSMIDPRYGALH